MADDDITVAPPQLTAGTPSITSHNRSEPQATFSLPQVTEDDRVCRGKFGFSPAQLHRLIVAHSSDTLRAYGGLAGLSRGLRTDVNAGLSLDEDIVDDHAATTVPQNQATGDSCPASLSRPGGYTDRRHTYGENRVSKRNPKTLLQLMWLAFNDKLMFLLTASAMISLALGTYQSVTAADDEPSIEWVEGVAIIIAVIIIVMVTALNDYQKNYKFQKLNQKKEERMVKVTRSGKHHEISIFDVLVGDVLHIETGDVTPADGVLIEGFNIQCDESALTGESDLVDKTPGQQTCSRQYGDHFILNGTKVVNGVGIYLVLSVGPNSIYGRIMMSLQEDVQVTPLQQKLSVMAKYIVNFGLIAGGIFFAVMFIRYLVQLKDIKGGARAKGEEFLDILILSITVVVIAVPEGLPLTVTLALAFATTRMLKDKSLVRLLHSCEVMGNATTICSDKTGTLTQNKMSVVAGVIGTSIEFTNDTTTTTVTRQNTVDQPLSTNRVAASLSKDVVDLLKASFALNSTVMETSPPGEIIGSSTETALLRFALASLGMDSVDTERTCANTVRMIPFDAARKWMAVIVKLSSGQYRMLVKGAAEVILDKCTQAIQTPQQGMSTKLVTPEDLVRLNKSMLDYAQRSLRVVAVAYRDFREQPSNTTNLCDLVFIGAFGIRDPLRPEVVESVRQCQSAGVVVRMVTGDNFFTAKAIATECGIYTAGGIAMDGPTFRKLTPAQLDLAAPRLQILARSSPDDKMRLVSHLRRMNEVVAVTGDGTNDAPALKAADVGLSMGISRTEVAREASAIVLMDDNFATIVKAIAWGRAVNDAAKKFLQFQFTINATAGLLTVISALVGGPESSVFSVVQLLWINLIMDTFAALALSTDFPSQSLLSRKPEPRTASVLNTTVWKMVIGQSIYQLAVIFTMHYAGESIFRYHTEHQRSQLQTMTFNTYVWMQFFNQANSRRSDNRLNIMEDVLRNPWFMLVQAVTLAGQVVIIFVGGEAFEAARLTSGQWGWSLLFGFLTIPLGALIRLIPDEASTPDQAGLKAVRQKEYSENASAPVMAIGNAEDDMRLVEIRRPSTVAVAEEFDLVGVIKSVMFSAAEYPPGFEIHPETNKEDYASF